MSITLMATTVYLYQAYSRPPPVFVQLLASIMRIRPTANVSWLQFISENGAPKKQVQHKFKQNMA